MKDFNSGMGADQDDDYQSNLARREPRAPELASAPAPADQQRRQSQQTAAAGGGSRPESRQSQSGQRLIVDELQQDLQYLSREAPLDGGESTFGVYSQLGGSQQAVHGGRGSPAGAGPLTTQAHLPHFEPPEGQAGEPLLMGRMADFRDESEEQQQYQSQQSNGHGSAINQYSAALDQMAPDNVEAPAKALQSAGFLVSFMVDARGGAMRGCRHSGVRVIIPPMSANMPMRITCRYLRRERLVHPPPLMEGEACASKIIEVGPAGAHFLGPVVIEVPHFASLRGKEREIIILRSDRGDVWREHIAETSEQLVEQLLASADQATADHILEPAPDENQRPHSATGDRQQHQTDSNNTSDPNARRLTRIVTTEFPQYFAIISRIKQDVHAVGPEGAAVSSQAVPKVQAIFTEGALTKRIKIGLQAQSVPEELVMKLFGSLTSVTFSPIVTIEPRRRKFHCPIRLKMPLPAGYRAETAPNLRLLCSITGGQSKALWEDVTGSTPLSIQDQCLLFTTTVSARFWLVHCRSGQRCAEAARYAAELYRYLCAVPFMAKFVVFAKRRDISEANVRAFCMTDDKEERTLEVQEHYTLVARSKDVEVLDGQALFLEFRGNLQPLVAGALHERLQLTSASLINEQLAFVFRAFEENRLAFGVRLRDVGLEANGRLAFMEDSMRYLASLNQAQRAYLLERRRKAVCTLGVQLPPMCVHYDSILGTPKRNSYTASARVGDLTLADIAGELGGPRRAGDNYGNDADSLNGDDYQRAADHYAAPADARAQPPPQWMQLAPRLGIPRDEVEFIQEHCAGAGSGAGGSGRRPPAAVSAVSPALLLLMHWYRLSNELERDQDLARALLAIGRDDLVARLNFAVEPKRISRSTMELLQEIDQIPVRSTENLYAASELSARSAHSLRRLNYEPYPLRQRQASASAASAASAAAAARRDGAANVVSVSRSESPPMKPFGGARAEPAAPKEWTADEDRLFDGAQPTAASVDAAKSKRQRRKRG